MEYKNRKHCFNCCIPDKPPVEPEKPVVLPESCKLFKITSISKVNGKVVVTFDDCTYLSADLSVVDNSLIGSINEDLFNRLTELELNFKKLNDSIINIEDSNGDVSFRALQKLEEN